MLAIFAKHFSSVLLALLAVLNIGYFNGPSWISAWIIVAMVINTLTTVRYD
jgi:hypothetical protein